MRRLVITLATLLLGACVSVEVGHDSALQRLYAMHDAQAAAGARRDAPLVPALLIQSLPGNAVGETLSIAYSRRANELAYYQLASWNERPVRQIPRLLQQRLEARGLAGAVGLIGDPLPSDWLLTLRVDRFEHDVSAPPGRARVQLTAELFDRRHPGRVARRQFEAGAPTPTADSAAAVAAMSQALSEIFDAMVPWLETGLQSGAGHAGRGPATP
jgi:ABC-type uncharacterized transport system auxiliary subunit